MIISFDSGIKTKGKCNIIFTEENICNGFIVHAENKTIYANYKVKSRIDENLILGFTVIDPNGEEINIPSNRYTVSLIISYIIAKESNKTEDELKTVIDYITKDKAVIDYITKDKEGEDYE